MEANNIDKLIADNVMAFGRVGNALKAGDKVLNYSTRDNLAFEVVDHMMAQGWRGFSIEFSGWQNPERAWVATFVGNMPIDSFTASSTTRATAICLAALEAMGVGEDGESEE